MPSWEDIGLGIATGGLYNVGKYAYDKAYKGPADEQKKGYYDAGQQSADLGTNLQGQYQNAGQTALSYFSGTTNQVAQQQSQQQSDKRLSDLQTKRAAGTASDAELNELSTLQQKAYAAGYTQDKQTGQWTAPAGRNAAGAAAAAADAAGPISPDQALIDQTKNRPMQQQQYFDYMKGQVGGLTNQETLYNERKSGTDPAAAYMDKRAIDQINNQLAARGRFNSGPGVRQISDYEANANAQRSQQLADLAGGADSSRLGLDTAYGSAATGASGEQSKYFGDLTDASQKLAQSKADAFGHYSDEGMQAYSQGQLAQIEANLAASGVDAATIHQFMSDISSVGGGIASIATGSKKGASGAGSGGGGGGGAGAGG